MSRALTDADRPPLADLVPLLRRVATLDPRTVARLQIADGRATAWVRLPFGVLASRRVGFVAAAGPEALDVTVRAAETLAWLEEAGTRAPESADSAWRWAVPPASGWRHVEAVPDDVIRPLVRTGALTLKAAAEREGVPGAQPRAEVADALLDSVVLTVSGEAGRAEITLRALSALTRLGFLPRGGEVRIDVAGRWIRVAGGYGSTYLETPGGLRLAPG